MSAVVSPSRAQPGDAVETSPGPSSPPDLPRPGEVLLTPGQKIALLKIRHSDGAKAVLAALEPFGRAECAGFDYRALAVLGLAINKGSFHVLAPAGRWRADRVAMELAREIGLHSITYNLKPRYGSAAKAQCTCGWVTFRTRAIPSYAIMIMRDGRHHLEHVSVALASESEPSQREQHGHDRQRNLP